MYFEQSYLELIDQIKAIDDVGIDPQSNADIKKIYREAKDARSDARQIERQYYLNEGDDTSSNYWQTVAKLSLDILLNYSRDVDVMAWLLESLCRLDGYAGCAFAFEVVTILVEKFGDNLYPSIDADDPEDYQWMGLTGLNGEDGKGSLLAPLTNVCICQDPVIYLWEYQRLIHADTSGAQGGTEEKYSLNELQDYVQVAGQDAMLYLLSSVNKGVELFAKMSDVLWDTLKDMSPPTSAIRDVLVSVQRDITQLAKTVFGESILSKEVDLEEKNIGIISEESTISIMPNQANSREQAIQSLNEVAHYFKKIEPHSPIPYMLYRVIEWSKMSWPELMATMIKDQDEINHIVKQTGMPWHQEGS